MEIVEVRYFPGPNRHTLSPAAEVVLDLGEWAERTSRDRPGFVDRLLAILPGLAEHHCGLGRPGGLVERLREGTYLGHVAEHIALELEHLAGEDSVYGKTRRMGDSPRWVRVVFEAESEAGARAAIAGALDLIRRLWADDADAVDAVGRWREAVNREGMGPSTRALVQAARRRGIPVARLDAGSYLRLGQGVQQRRLYAASTDRTSVIAVDVAQDKAWTKTVLQDAGIPTPPGRVVHSLAELGEAVQSLGFPVVVKPVRGRQGMGVSAVGSPGGLERAWVAANLVGDGPVLVERQVLGTPYRLLVVGRELVAAAERIPPAVVGDGRHTIRELVAALNRDPRRGPGHGYAMSEVPLDAPALLCLAEQGFGPDDIPPAGRRVALRWTANLSTGATAKNVTGAVSPDLAHDAVRAAQAVGLDIAGVDIVTPDLGAGLREVGGAVIEVNAVPGLRMHLFPAEGEPEPVADRIVAYLFGTSQGRIPVAAVTGTNGKTTVTRMLGHIWSTTGRQVGMATTDGILVGSRLVAQGDFTGPWSARLILNDPSVEVAVLETARGGMARGGLGFDDVDVGVVTNIGPDHLGQDGVETLEDLVHLKALVVDVVRREGAAVLNADDPLVQSMAPRCRGRVVWFSLHGDNVVVTRHLEAGGAAVVVRQGHLVWAVGSRRSRLIGVRALPAALGGVAAINVANAAAAAAAALAMGLPPRVVAQGLATFPAGGQGVNRGRLEVRRGVDLTVVIDYAHNQPAVAALGEVCRRMKAKVVVTVLGLPGDRRNADLKATAEAVARFSHRVVVREDHDLRGRRPGEVAALLAAALQEAGMGPDRVVIEEDEGTAVRRALYEAPPGALCLVLYERYGVVSAAVEDGLAMRRRWIEARDLVSAAKAR
ncbi:MAG: cyanophycin synthetase [Firmicutes bacterium]|nr:cyanophycin synthetase [Alicyclobacillaceae bacterium]MCL6497221.1 cyanophycin synthetase [Bacillota bacterium]